MRLAGSFSALVFSFCLISCQNLFAASDSPDLSWTDRVVTEDELLAIERADPSLDLNSCREILSRLNAKEPFYIRKDIRQGASLKVPVNFAAYRNWTPLPARLPDETRTPKLILIVKDASFIGWYENGVLVGDSEACTGTAGQDTKAGLFHIEQKDSEHTSASYTNDYGTRAWMPFSLRIYETVWIHAGNVFGAHCSHGCVILPMDRAETLYKWAEPGIPVLILEKL